MTGDLGGEAGGETVDASPATDRALAEVGVTPVDAGIDASTADVGAGSADVSATDAGGVDAVVGDVIGDAVDDLGARDATGASVDRVEVDLPAVSDAPAVIDVARAADVAAADVVRDAPPVDVGCAGAAPSVHVDAPASGEAIETCTASGRAVDYDFTATVTSAIGLRSVGARWVTPDGLEAPPPATLSAPPYRFRRQVGGPSTGAPALSVFGIRGTWHFEVTALDACGRSTVASQPFSLTFTTRRCPNP